MQGWLKLVCQPVFYHLFAVFTAWQTEEYKSFAQSTPTQKQNEVKKKLGAGRQFWVQFHNSSLLSKWKFCVFSTTSISSSWLHIPNTCLLWLLDVSRSENLPIHQITTLDLLPRSLRSYLSRHKEEVGLHCWVIGKGPEEEQISQFSSSQTLCILTFHERPVQADLNHFL